MKIENLNLEVLKEFAKLYKALMQSRICKGSSVAQCTLTAHRQSFTSKSFKIFIIFFQTRFEKIGYEREDPSLKGKN
jgi:hypothetical protein